MVRQASAGRPIRYTAIPVPTLFQATVGPDVLLIGVEGGGNPEVLAAEAAVAEQRLSEVAHPDHRHGPRVVRAEDVPHRPDQFFTAVADARVAELPEEAEVLANLGVTEAEQRAQLPRGDRVLAGRDQSLQFAQIERQPADDDLGNRCIRRHVSRLGG